jgi:hypothetical protein
MAEDLVVFDEPSAAAIADMVKRSRQAAPPALRDTGGSQRTSNVQTVRVTSITGVTGHVAGVAVTLYPGKVVTGVQGTFADAGDCWLMDIRGAPLSLVDYYASAKSAAVNEDDGLPLFILAGGPLVSVVVVTGACLLVSAV